MFPLFPKYAFYFKLKPNKHEVSKCKRQMMKSLDNLAYRCFSKTTICHVWRLCYFTGTHDQRSFHKEDMFLLRPELVKWHEEKIFNFSPFQLANRNEMEIVAIDIYVKYFVNTVGYQIAEGPELNKERINWLTIIMKSDTFKNT